MVLHIPFCRANDSLFIFKRPLYLLCSMRDSFGEQLMFFEVIFRDQFDLLKKYFPTEACVSANHLEHFNDKSLHHKF